MDGDDVTDDVVGMEMADDGAAAAPAAVAADVEEEDEEDLVLGLDGEALVMMVNERPLNDMWERLSPLVAFLLNT